LVGTVSLVVLLLIELLLLSATVVLVLAAASLITATLISAVVCVTSSVVLLCPTVTATSTKVTTCAAKASPVTSSASEIATSPGTSSAEPTPTIAPRTPATTHAPSNVTAIFERCALAYNLFKVIRPGKRLVHAEVLVLVITILEAPALVLHGSIDGRCGCVDVQSGPGGDVDDGRFVIAVGPGPLFGLLLALVFGLLLIV